MAARQIEILRERIARGRTPIAFGCATNGCRDFVRIDRFGRDRRTIAGRADPTSSPPYTPDGRHSTCTWRATQTSSCPKNMRRQASRRNRIAGCCRLLLGGLRFEKCGDEPRYDSSCRLSIRRCAGRCQCRRASSRHAERLRESRSVPHARTWTRLLVCDFQREALKELAVVPDDEEGQ